MGQAFLMGQSGGSVNFEKLESSLLSIRNNNMSIKLDATWSEVCDAPSEGLVVIVCASYYWSSVNSCIGDSAVGVIDVGSGKVTSLKVSTYNTNSSDGIEFEAKVESGKVYARLNGTTMSSGSSYGKKYYTVAVGVK